MERLDEGHEGRVANWLAQICTKNQENLVLGYYSLLLHKGISPVDAAIKTLETMGPAQLQNTTEAFEKLMKKIDVLIQIYLRKSPRINKHDRME